MARVALAVAALLVGAAASPLWDYVHRADPTYSYVARAGGNEGKEA